MRIGIDCRFWNESGVGRYTRNLVQELIILDAKNEYVLFAGDKAAQDIKYQISSVRQAQDDSEFTEESNIKNKWKIIEANIRWHSIEEQLKFPSILNKENLDLVHFPYFSFPVFYNKPFIVTIHDLIINHFNTGEASTLARPVYKMKRFAYDFVISQAAKKAKKIITVSQSTKDEIVDHLKVNPNKIMVTYEGADLQRSNIKNRISKIDKQYFLYVGNAYPHKNLDRLIEAFSIFCHQNDIKLVLVGREDYFYKRLKEKVKKMNLQSSIIFYGEASDAELIGLYKNALALVMPSLMEGFGLPPLEAMASKCLVLASDIPAFKEICSDSAIYFDPLNSNNIVNALNEIIHSNDTYHYGDLIKKGFERSKKFQWKKMAQETLNIYKSCSPTSSE